MKRCFLPNLQRYLITGVITVIPIWITWLVFNFIFTQLSRAGRPWVKALVDRSEAIAPDLSHWLLEPWFQNSLAVILTLVALYVLGWLASLVAGKKMLALLDLFLNRIPLVQTIYGSTKKLLRNL